MQFCEMHISDSSIREMNTTQLNHFRDVMRFGSFLRASRETQISQPALSRSVALLESTLGVRLINRTRSGLTLTEAGQSILKEGSDILDRLDHLASRFADGTSRGQTSIRLAASENLCIHVFPKWVNARLVESPQFSIDLTSGTSEEIEEQVNRGSADVGVFYNPPSKPGTIRKVLGEVEFRLIFPKGKSRKNMKDLPFVGSRESDYTRPYFAKRTLQKNGIVPTSVISSNSQEAQIRMVAAGVGYSVVPSFLAQAYCGEILVDSKFSERSKLYVISRKRLDHALEQSLIQALKPALICH
ncbi:MAG: LysR family transcriptional regulator, partial [Proteobacteria bacterium]